MTLEDLGKNFLLNYFQNKHVFEIFILQVPHDGASVTW